MVNCGYCGKTSVMVSSLEFYGRDYGTNVYKCGECNAYVGTHKGTTIPLGTLANAELRELRRCCHSLIDPYWKSGKYKRTTIYKRMSKALNIPIQETHIGMFDKETCLKLIGFFKRKIK